LIAVAILGVILVYKESCCEVVCTRHRSPSLLLPCAWI